MKSKKFRIKNRDGVELVGVLDLVENATGIAFIAHGLSGDKYQPQMETFAQACNESGYSAVRWDAANTIGESGGDLKYASVTSYYADLEDVIAWAKTQSWYIEPFVLIGHSLGGISVGLYAEQYPEKVKGLAPLSTVVSGELSKQSKVNRGIDLEKWKRDGFFEEERQTAPGTKKVYYAELEDRLKYDLLTQAKTLTMPLLFIVGSKDDGTPFEHQKLLMDASASRIKEIHIIEGSGHSYIQPHHLAEVKKIIVKWLQKL